MLLFFAAARASALLKRLIRARPIVPRFVAAKGMCPPSKIVAVLVERSVPKKPILMP
jgi:hypothetical protein